MMQYFGRTVPKKLLVPRNFMGFTFCRNQSKEATFEIPGCKLHKLATGPPQKTLLSRDDGLKLYYQMTLIRKMEYMAAELYKVRLVRGFLHLYVAQEAVCCGMKAAMKPNDSVITAYRCHGWAYVLGIEPKAILAELMGKVTGCSRGKGGSMHMYTPTFLGGNGIVGAQVPVGTGMAFSYKYLNKPNVNIALYGDGAANQGQIFEAYNLAKIHMLPIIFVCENNRYGMGTKATDSSASTEYYNRCNYMSGLVMDGMDVLAVREATRFAIDYCVKGNGPFMIEADTYRYLGHSVSDPGTSYRTREEVKQVRESRDCIAQHIHRLIDGKLATEEELKAIDKAVKEEVDAITNQSKADKGPPIDELASNVYSKPLTDKVRGISPWDYHPSKNIGTPINMQ